MAQKNKVFPINGVVFLFFLFSILITVYSKFISSSSYHIPQMLNEQFDERLLRINSEEKIDSLVRNKFTSYKYDTAKIVFFIDQFIRNRFYHSYSNLSLKDNWVSYLCGKILWKDFGIPVIPKDIIKYPMAACSQQGLVFQHQLKLLKIPCRTIEFKPTPENKNGHYAVSVYYDNSWHFYDSNQEPVIVDSLMPSIDKIIELKLYKKMYVKPSNRKSQSFFKSKSYFTINNNVYYNGNMFYFQSITNILSNWGWLFFLVAWLFLFFKRKSTM